jgi:hypothetical protein
MQEWPTPRRTGDALEDHDQGVDECGGPDTAEMVIEKEFNCLSKRELGLSISDGDEIIKRLPKALPKPTTHIIDWFHIALKIQPLQRAASGHILLGSVSLSVQSDVLDMR